MTLKDLAALSYTLAGIVSPDTSEDKRADIALTIFLRLIEKSELSTSKLESS